LEYSQYLKRTFNTATSKSSIKVKNKKKNQTFA